MTSTPHSSSQPGNHSSSQPGNHSSSQPTPHSSSQPGNHSSSGGHPSGGSHAPSQSPAKPGSATDLLPTTDDVRDVLAGYAPDIAVQPILDLSRAQVCSYEALARFPAPAGSAPQAWFAAAHQAGLGPALEARAVSRALEVGRDRPAGTILSVNVSPSVLTTPELRAVLPHDLTGLQFEVTENEIVPDRAALVEVLTRLRRRGARIAVDDVGEGYAGLQRVMEIRPDVLKLDRALVSGVHREPAKAAMVDAVVRYAARTGALVCGEGVETSRDLAALADLDVAQAQGFLVGRPALRFEEPSDEALDACRRSLSRVLRADGGWTGERWRSEKVLASLADAPDLVTLCRRLDGVAALIRADLASLSFLTPDGSVLRRLLPDSDALGAESFPVEDYPVTRQVIERHEVAAVAVGDGPAHADQVVVLQDLGFSGALLVPLSCGGRAVGLLELYRLEDDPWTRAHIGLARTVAAVLGPVATTLRPAGV